MFGRLAGHGMEQALQLEPALQAFHLKAHAADELGQGFELARAGRLVHAAQEVQIVLGQQFGHGLVGRDHELFDNLVADRVLHQMGAAHLAGLVQVDLHFAHRQLQRPRQPPPAQQHRQRVHPADQRMHLGRELARQESGSARYWSISS